MAAEEGYGYEWQTKSYSKRRLLPQFDDEAVEPSLPRQTQGNQLDRPLEEGTERLAKPKTHLPLSAVKARRWHNQNTNMIFDTTWPLEPVSLGPSMGHEVILSITETDTRHGLTETT